MVRRHLGAQIALAIAVAGLAGGEAHAGAQTADEQHVLGPGLYEFQTRTRGASCDDDERTGYVSSFVAPIHGIPGARRMRMQILNSPYWSTWSITVNADGMVVGESRLDGSSGPNAPMNRFEVRHEGSGHSRFIGHGERSYTATVDGESRRCTVHYDALLRRINL